MTNTSSGTYEVASSCHRQPSQMCSKGTCASVTKIFCVVWQVVANYFGGNGSFQLLPGISADRFTLKGRHKSPPEVPEKSCKMKWNATLTFASVLNWCAVNKRVMFWSHTGLSHRWIRSFGFDWSHSGSCSRSCNAYYILLHQVPATDTHLLIIHMTVFSVSIFKLTRTQIQRGSPGLILYTKDYAITGKQCQFQFTVKAEVGNYIARRASLDFRSWWTGGVGN